MPDITACITADCPRRHGCARYMTVYSAYQSLSIFDARTCPYYMTTATTPYPLLSEAAADKRATAHGNDMLTPMDGHAIGK